MCYIRKRQCNKTGKETFSAPLIFTFIFHEHLKPHCKKCKKISMVPQMLALCWELLGSALTITNMHQYQTKSGTGTPTFRDAEST